MPARLRTPVRAHTTSRRVARRVAAHVARRLPRIIRRGKTYGYFLSSGTLEDLTEDIEALSNPKFLASIRRARRDIAHGRTYTLNEVKRELCIR